MRRYREKIKDDPGLIIIQIVSFHGRNEVFSHISWLGSYISIIVVNLFYV